MCDVGPDFWLGYFDANAETLAPSIEVEDHPAIEGDLLRLVAWHGYRRVGTADGKVLFNLLKRPRLPTGLTPDTGMRRLVAHGRWT